jgi:TonB family protein
MFRGQRRKGGMNTVEIPIVTELPPRKRVTILFFTLALLIHLLLFSIPLHWTSPSLPPKVEVQEIDPRKLEQIRQKWREKSLLLDKNPSRPKEKEAPPNAQYFSDRNTRVEKEQQARQTTVIPKSGKKSSQNTKTSSRTRRRLPDLGKLGIPFRLDSHLHLEEQHPLSSQAGDQALLDKRLPEGSENLLNTQESIYYSFYARIYETIGPIWYSRIQSTPLRTHVVGGEYTTVIELILDQNGYLLEIRRLQSSGVPEFDRSVEEAWQKVSRFPNPPKGLLDGEKKVHTVWSFRVHVGQGMNFQYLPPERDY